MEQHWSKEYIEHLRAIHFTLIFLCAAGIVTVLAPGNTEVSTARKQLDQVWALLGDWNPRFLQPDAATANDTSLINDSPINLKIGNNEFAIQLQLNQPTSFVTLDKPPITSSRTRCDQNPDHPGPTYGNPTRLGDLIFAPQNIQEFHITWDSLFDGATLHRPRWMIGKVFAKHFAGEFETATIEDTTPDPGKAQVVGLRIQCLIPRSEQRIQQLDPDVKTNYQLHGELKGARYDLYFPVQLDDTVLDAQALLFRGNTQSWHHGYFQDSFRDLSKGLEGQESLPWKNAEQILARHETGEQSENFEALGMKIPASLSAYGCSSSSSVFNGIFGLISMNLGPRLPTSKFPLTPLGLLYTSYFQPAPSLLFLSFVFLSW